MEEDKNLVPAAAFDVIDIASIGRTPVLPARDFETSSIDTSADSFVDTLMCMLAAVCFFFFFGCFCFCCYGKKNDGKGME